MGADRKGPLAAFIVVAIVAAILLVTSVRSQAAPGWLRAPASTFADVPSAPYGVWPAPAGGPMVLQQGVELFLAADPDSKASSDDAVGDSADAATDGTPDDAASGGDSTGETSDGAATDPASATTASSGQATSTSASHHLTPSIRPALRHVTGHHPSVVPPSLTDGDAAVEHGHGNGHVEGQAHHGHAYAYGHERHGEGHRDGRGHGRGHGHADSEGHGHGHSEGHSHGHGHSEGHGHGRHHGWTL